MLIMQKNNFRKKALIFGITGQDGSYLSYLLLKKGYEVIGTTRHNRSKDNLKNLRLLGIDQQVKLVTLSPDNYQMVRDIIISVKPDEIYYLAGQSSVALSFEQPIETFDSIVKGVCYILEVIKTENKKIRLFHASSSECFGDTHGVKADENTPFKPKSPYGIAKAAAHYLVSNYRESYGIFACNGILFNHESPLRPDSFVTQKIIQSVLRIKSGDSSRLKLGRIDIYRDWGWAQEYTDAMWRMLQLDEPTDLVICTGEANKLEDFIAEAFKLCSLDWRDWVEVNHELFRPSEILYSCGNPERAEKVIGWRAKYKMKDVVKFLLNQIYLVSD